MHISFARDQWNMDGLTYAYSWRFEETPRFIQAEEWVESGVNPAAGDGFDNMALLTEKTYAAGTTITARCSFREAAAPLIMLADRLDTDARGVKRFGNYIEVVLYKNGINVWRLWRENGGGRVVWHKRLGVVFPVTEEEIHELTVEVGDKTLTITVDGTHRMTLRVEDLFPAFHAGIDACEGLIRFYSLEIDAPAAE